MVDDDDTIQYEEKQESCECSEPGCEAHFFKLINLQRRIIIIKYHYFIEHHTRFALGNFRTNIAGDAENWMRMQEATEVLINDLKLIRPGMLTGTKVGTIFAAGG